MVVASAKSSPLLFENSEDMVEVASLHLGGRQDKVVPSEDLERVSSKFISPEVHIHEQGHCFPIRAEWLERVVGFVERQSSRDNVHVCADEEALVEQKEEVESILSIYPEVCVRVAPAESCGRPCAVLSVDMKNMNPDVTLPLTLVIHFTSKYPVHQVPIIRLEHNLSLADFSLQSQHALLQRLDAEAKDSLGNPSVFSIISCAEEWLLGIVFYH